MIHRNSLLIGLLVGSIVAALLYFFVLERPADAAEPPSLEFPVDCVISENCWYMAFVDLDSRSTYRDHMCGVRAYEAPQGNGYRAGSDHRGNAGYRGGGGGPRHRNPRWSGQLLRSGSGVSWQSSYWGFGQAGRWDLSITKRTR